MYIYFNFSEVLLYNRNMCSKSINPTVYKAYVDGSFKSSICRWALIVINEEEEIVLSRSGVLCGPVTEMAQIGGELKAAMEAVRFAKQAKCKVTIHHDYIGIYAWVSDLFGGGKPWRRKKIWTQDYAEYMTRNKDCVDSFVKVEAHSGDRWNDAVDLLAAQAAV